MPEHVGSTSEPPTIRQQVMCCGMNSEDAAKVKHGWRCMFRKWPASASDAASGQTT